jgi:thioredoxin 1
MVACRLAMEARRRAPGAEKDIKMATQPISDDSFEQDVLNSSDLVLVDFWAEWCGPCKQIGPALEEISTEMGAKVKITKINIDDNPNTPSKYGVRGIPTLMLFKNGEVAATQVGALPKGKIVEWIEKSI